MLTHTRVLSPGTAEFGNMNGFILTTSNGGALTFTLWNPDANDATVRTFEYAIGKCPVDVFVPLAVKKVAGSVGDRGNLTVYGV